VPELVVTRGDITTLRVDAIVNAANTSLAPGGGVCGAIHRAAGVDLAVACARLGGCPTGDARVTPGFDLPARHVIHAVGPVWHGGDHGEADLLAACYRAALARADEVGARSVAFPAISTGIFGYPLEPATRVAVDTVRTTPTRVETVHFVCFDDDTRTVYESAVGGPGRTG
jgi:O-acetyl-ADP-ribose deacetylase (regulator of RNase III)